MNLLAAVSVFLLILFLGIRIRSPQERQMEAQVKQWLPKALPPATSVATRVEAALRANGVPLGARQAVGLAFVGGVLLASLGHKLTGSLPVGLLVGAMGIAMPYSRLRQFERKRRETLSLQFKEALTSIAYSLRAGSSLQTAMERALFDLKRIFPGGAREPIVQEFEELVQQIRLGVPVEAVLADWDKRVELEDVSDFVSATLAVKTRGGNLTEVMTTISETISWKIVAQAQIRALTAEKRSEANLLTAMPPLVLGILALVSPSYIAPLFTTVGGQVVLLLGVACNILAFFAVRKVLESPL